MEFEILTDVNRRDFERIKFWNLVKTDEIIDNPNQNVVLLKANEEYAAYATEEHEKCREIHGIGKFKLR